MVEVAIVSKVDSLTFMQLTPTLDLTDNPTASLSDNAVGDVSDALSSDLADGSGAGRGDGLSVDVCDGLLAGVAADDVGGGVGFGVDGSIIIRFVDPMVLSEQARRTRLKNLSRVDSMVAAIRAGLLAVNNNSHGENDTQELLRNEMQLSNREAKRETETASRLAELPATSEALASGEIPKGHAHLIARASGESDVDEAFLAKTANKQGFDEFARTVKRHQQEVSTDDGESLVARQRKNRKTRIFESSDTGMYVLTGEFDQITGARIATALTNMERRLWHREDPKTRLTPQQRMADALTALICDSTSDGNGGGKSQGTDLLIIADYDALTQQLNNPRLADGSPIPLVELQRLALEANILPSIFDVKTQNMWLGRKKRTASNAQRIALIARDQQCVGCGANPLWCRAHHIKHWSNNGPTNLDNLVLVCDRCHHKIHDHNWQITQHPTNNKYQLKPPNPNTRTGTSGWKKKQRKDTPDTNAPSKTGKLNQQRRNKPPNANTRDRPDRDNPTVSHPSRPNPTTRPKPDNHRPTTRGTNQPHANAAK